MNPVSIESVQNVNELAADTKYGKVADLNANRTL